MYLSVATVAETLSHEFGDLRVDIVVRVLTACVDEYPDADALFIEQAARARLQILAHPQGGVRPPSQDALDVSLHDRELAAEVQLTVNLMVAVNESEQPLAAEDIDRILGVDKGAPQPAGHVVPMQRQGD